MERRRPRGSLKIGTTIDQYRIEERLGGGGMGEVFRARDLELERSVAIKCVRPELSELDEVTMRFRAEARTLAGLAHGNIATVFRFFPHDGTLYLVMEYISGQPFGDLLRDHGAQPAAEVVRLISQALAGLGYAHDNKVVHRDIKPGNLMLDGHNTVKVLDFGIAHLLDQTRITQSGSVLGTPAYMAPEQVLGRPVDGRTDLYSLGVVLFEMLTGKLPFQASSQFELMRAHLETQPRSLKEMSNSVPRSLQQTVIRALAKDSDQRYQSAAEFSTALQVALGEAKDDGHDPSTIAGGARSAVKVVVSPLSVPATEISAAGDATAGQTAGTNSSTAVTSIEIQLPPPKKAAGFGLVAALLVGSGVLIATGDDDDAPQLAQDVVASAQQLPGTESETGSIRPAQPNGRASIESGRDTTPLEQTADESASAGASIEAGSERQNLTSGSSSSVAPAIGGSKAVTAEKSATATTATTTTTPARKASVPRSAASSYVVRATKVSVHERQRTGRLSRAAGYNGSFALSAPQGAQPLQIEEFVEVYRDGVQISRQLIHSQSRRPGRFKSKQRILGLKELAAGDYRLRLVFENERRRLGTHEWSLAVAN